MQATSIEQFWPFPASAYILRDILAGRRQPLYGVAAVCRPIVSLWPYFLRPFFPFVVLAVPLVSYVGPFALLIIAAYAAWLLWGRRSHWLWRFMREVRRFRTASNGRIVLHYAPKLRSKRNMAAVLKRCEAKLDQLTERFGFPLRRQVVVYLFASYNDIGKIFGPEYGGTALPLANAIVIAHDDCIGEAIVHEFVHLFSARWSPLAPPLLSEGLAVWLQETVWGQPVDTAVRPLLDNRALNLPLLLKPGFFFAEPHRHACYVLAGSFTGFLIRRYGWQRYCELFRHCNSNRFREKFEKCVGVTLEKAEWQWRNEILIMEIFNRRLGRNVNYRSGG